MRNDDFPLLKSIYELLKETLPRLGRFPREQRSGLARQILDYQFLLQSKLERGISRPEARIESMRDANEVLNILRTYWQLANELGFVSHSAYFNILKQLNEIGVMVGGFLHKSSNLNPSSGVFPKDKV